MLGEQATVEFGQRFRQVLGDEARTDGRAGFAVKPNRRRGRLEAWHALRQEPRHQTRKDVAGPRAGEPGRGIVGYGGATIRCGNDGVRAFEKHDGARQCGGLACLLKLRIGLRNIRQSMKKSIEFAGMGR